MIHVEVVAQSAEDAVAAERAGAHRVELCSALALDGLTPSFGLVRAVWAHTGLPIVAMVRPRPGGFAYTEPEFEAMEADVEAVLEAGADGIVTGILQPDGRIDARRCRKLIARAGGRPVAFHRAFDVAPDPHEALEALVDLGVARILTAGGSTTALQGADRIRDLVERAAGRIEIMAGGQVRSANVRELVARAAVDQVHLAPRQECHDPTEGVYGPFQRISEAAVAEVVEVVRSFGEEA